MANESIYSSRKPGFPKDSEDEGSYGVIIEYVGLDSVLRPAMPGIGDAWGEYDGRVTSVSIDPEPGSLYSTLTVSCSSKFDTSTSEQGTKLENETSYEIDWVDVQRSLFEHPVFAAGGARELSSEDKSAIESWKNNPDTDYKPIFIYVQDGDYSEGVTSLDPELSTNAKYLATGILKGIEYWVDKVPIARRTDTWVNGPPPAGSAGQKEEPIGFPNLPPGYEWIRDADRALRAGGQNTWSNETSWIGSRKVLIDVDEIYWTL